MKLTKIILLVSGLVLGANANSLCGNGVKDLQEECDPSDSSRKGWGNKGCSEMCIAQHGPICDMVTRHTLRHGRSYSFGSQFVNKSKTNLKIQNVKANFKERKDFNGKTSTPIFTASKWIKNKNYIVNTPEQGSLTQSLNRYGISYHPKIRQMNFVDIIIQYTTSMSKIINSQERGYYIQTQCDQYKITWCGDGCNATCQLEN